MATPSKSSATDRMQNDPGVSNDPKSDVGNYQAHMWHSLNQIFERLGKLDQKLDQLGSDQEKLKASVEKHDKLITKAIYWGAGAIAVILALWFVYDHFLKDHIAFK